MKLNFKNIGEGDPVIILHGLFGSLDNWMTMARKLGDSYNVFLVDQRNHGKSPHSDEMDYTAMAQDLAEFIDDHNIKNPKLIGHSMGGKTIIQYAMMQPEIIDRMIVIDIGFKSYPMHHQKILAGLNNLDLPTLESRSQAEERIAEFIDEKAVQFFLLKGLYRKPEGGYGLKFNLPSLEENMNNILAEINGEPSHVDTLFVRGALSGYIVEDDYEQIALRFLNSKIETVENSGHWIHAEQPEQLKSLILDYFSQN